MIFTLIICLDFYKSAKTLDVRNSTIREMENELKKIGIKYKNAGYNGNWDYDAIFDTKESPSEKIEKQIKEILQNQDIKKEIISRHLCRWNRRF